MTQDLQRDKPSQKRIFITGGASGLGRALAEIYGADGWNVLIGDINAARLVEAAAVLSASGITVHSLSCDVRQEADLIAARDWLESNWGGVDIVVNNAGVSVAGAIEDTSLDDWNWILDINLLGVVRGCKVFTPLLKKQGSGWLINIASMAGLIHPPQMSPYNASKAAVVALSETLKAELFNDGIGVSVVCPAFFRTNLAETQRTATAALDSFTRKLVNKAKVGPEEIAALIKAGVEHGDFHILTHPKERNIWRFKRFVPYPVYFKAVKREVNRVFKRKPAANS